MMIHGFVWTGKVMSGARLVKVSPAVRDRMIPVVASFTLACARAACKVGKSFPAPTVFVT